MEWSYMQDPDRLLPRVHAAQQRYDMAASYAAQGGGSSHEREQDLRSELTRVVGLEATYNNLIVSGSIQWLMQNRQNQGN